MLMGHFTNKGLCSGLYICNQCDCGFACISSLNQHVLGCHKQSAPSRPKCSSPSSSPPLDGRDLRFIVHDLHSRVIVNIRYKLSLCGCCHRTLKPKTIRRHLLGCHGISISTTEHKDMLKSIEWCLDIEPTHSPSVSDIRIEKEGFVCCRCKKRLLFTSEDLEANLFAHDCTLQFI